MIDIRVQAADFDPGRQLARLEELGAGAVATLTGLLEAPAETAEIRVDHYPAFAKAELARIAGEAQAERPLAGLILIHRHGRMRPGERAFFVGVAASDRGAALQAVADLAEAVRRRAPFWRKDVTASGEGRWR